MAHRSAGKDQISRTTSSQVHFCMKPVSPPLYVPSLIPPNFALGESEPPTEAPRRRCSLPAQLGVDIHLPDRKMSSVTSVGAWKFSATPGLSNCLQTRRPRTSHTALQLEPPQCSPPADMGVQLRTQPIPKNGSLSEKVGISEDGKRRADLEDRIRGERLLASGVYGRNYR